jgi:hypothetical protein
MTSQLLLANIAGFPTVVGLSTVIEWCFYCCYSVPAAFRNLPTAADVPTGIGPMDNLVVAVVPAIADVPADY